jgi:tRNA A-37 threonylcarbamoyl transferase component Bud32
MPIPFTCTGCGSKLRAPESAAGHTIQCPKCRTPLSVSSPAASAGAPTTDETPASPGPAADGCPAEAPPRPADTDRNLLFGVLALQAALIDNNQSAEACAAWTTRKDTPLAHLLVERGLLTVEERQEVERLVQRHLTRHGGDARASLAAVAGGAARVSLDALPDPDVRASLDGLPRRGHYVPVATIAYEPKTRQRYTMTRLHATGGIGQGWLARDEDLGRDVALKELRTDRGDSSAAAARFLEEAKITGQLEHPGIVPVYELVQPQDGPPCYAMRFVGGRTLADAIKEYHRKRQAGEAGPLALRELLTVFVGICNAVAYAHSRGVLHRDLKPQNVALGDFGEVMVLDWGLAKVVGKPEDPASLLPVDLGAGDSRDETRQEQVLGTPGYMAPEQAEGRLDLLDERSDIYGLGAILYEVLTGAAPFGGAVRRRRSAAPTPPRCSSAWCRSRWCRPAGGWPGRRGPWRPSA